MKALNPINHLALKPNNLIAQSQIRLPFPNPYLLYNTYKLNSWQSDLGAPNGRILCTFLAFL
jgi:hypothetical protein